MGSESYSRKDIQSTVYEIEGLFKNAESSMRKKTGKKRLNKNQKELIEVIKKIALEKNVKTLVIGYPLNMNFKENRKSNLLNINYLVFPLV